MKCLSLGTEVTESLCFFSLLIGTCDISRRKGSIFSVRPLSPNIQQPAGEVAAPLSHPHPTWWTSVLGRGCISHRALCWVQAKSGKSQKKGLMVPVPRGHREGSAAATSKPDALPLHFLPMSPSTVASHPTFLIFLGPALVSEIPCWVLLEMYCSPDIDSMGSMGHQPGCGMGATLRGKVQPGCCGSRWTTAMALGTSTQPSCPGGVSGWAKGR